MRRWSCPAPSSLFSMSFSSSKSEGCRVPEVWADRSVFKELSQFPQAAPAPFWSCVIAPARSHQPRGRYGTEERGWKKASRVDGCIDQCCQSGLALPIPGWFLWQFDPYLERRGPRKVGWVLLTTQHVRTPPHRVQGLYIKRSRHLWPLFNSIRHPPPQPPVYYFHWPWHKSIKPDVFITLSSSLWDEVCEIGCSSDQCYCNTVNVEQLLR